MYVAGCHHLLALLPTVLHYAPVLDEHINDAVFPLVESSTRRPTRCLAATELSPCAPSHLGYAVLLQQTELGRRSLLTLRIPRSSRSFGGWSQSRLSRCGCLRASAIASRGNVTVRGGDVTRASAFKTFSPEGRPGAALTSFHVWLLCVSSALEVSVCLNAWHPFKQCKVAAYELHCLASSGVCGKYFLRFLCEFSVSDSMSRTCERGTGL